MDIEIREIEIRDLRPNSGEVEGLPRNPRKISKKNLEKLKKSVQDAPEMLRLRELIVIPHGDGYVVIAGNQRLEAAKAVGMTALPCKVLPADTDPAKLREYAIKDNLPFGEDDWEIIASDWDTAELEEWGMSVPREWKDIKTAEEDDFDPDSVKETVCKKGDIWQLGDHRLMCGDSTDAGDVALLMDGEKADLLLTDPPYNFETEGGGILRWANSMKQVRENNVDKFDPSILHNYAKTNIYFHNRALIKSYIELAEKEGLNYDLAIYKKRGLPNYAGHLMTDIEYIAIIGEQAPNIGLEMKYYSKVFEGNKDQDNDLSYSKPIAICDKFLRLYSKEGDNIIDLFGGSGTTLIAAEQLNRKCYMMELDPHYCDIIIARWEKLTGKKATKIN